MTLRALHGVPAPAKLNLFLHVVGRRDDGYHLLQSIFVLIDWADCLHFELRDDGRLQRHDLTAPLPTDDLCLRAAHALRDASGTPLGADIHIDKQLPAGAGMGGGSSDAASTLLALNRLWALNWPRQRLAAIGLTLGADVPFFVHGANAFVEGIGERIMPISLPVAGYAVVKPLLSLDTRSIFTHPDLRRDTEPVIISGSLEGAPQRAFTQIAAGAAEAPWASPGFGRNDLQGPAEDRCPQVAEAARWLQARFGNSRMTGSGSAVFARVIPAIDVAELNSDPGSAARPQAMPVSTDPLAGLPPGWVGRMCYGLPRHPLAEWAA